MHRRSVADFSRAARTVTAVHIARATRARAMPARVTVVCESVDARARAAIAALASVGLGGDETHRVVLDALTPTARARREGLLRALLGCDEGSDVVRALPCAFVGDARVGGVEELTAMARSGALARKLLESADAPSVKAHAALEDASAEELDDPGEGSGGGSLYGRSKSLKLEPRAAEPRGAAKPKETGATPMGVGTDSYVKMMELMKRAMRYKRLGAVMDETALTRRRRGAALREAPTMSKEEIIEALVVVGMTLKPESGDELSNIDFHSLERFVQEGVLVPREKAQYALPMDIDRRVLNSYRMKWTDRVTSNPVNTSAYLRKMFLLVESRHVDQKTGKVDYGAIALDDQFGAFEEATCELREIRLDEGELANEEARKAFLLNVYNVAVKHAFVNVGVPQTRQDRSLFYGSVGYVIGGEFYTLDDIEHGLLRANAPHPSRLFASTHFKSKGSPQAKMALSKRDPRIHFALNCGANSCPPIRAYEASRIDAQLDLATSAFLSSTVSVDERKRLVTLSKIMRWYAKDFGKGNAEILTFVTKGLKGEAKSDLEALLAGGRMPRIGYTEYDWSTDSFRPRPVSLVRYASLSGCN